MLLLPYNTLIHPYPPSLPPSLPPLPPSPETYTLHGNGLTFTLPAYSAYAQQQQDDLPLYIFDSRFIDKCPGLAQDYLPFLPKHFQQVRVVRFPPFFSRCCASFPPWPF